MNQYRNEILTSALEAREREVIEYQVNIDNFTSAIQKCGDDPELAEFRGNLEALLSSSKLEQRKAEIMLEVIQEQLA
ncbi:MAG: hypothetical protein GX071_14070 [Gammaproteobacteria bacterium]|jgi:hypothetical protein|nr:hypothetical protein [Gammaproteobacteria bacterium]